MAVGAAQCLGAFQASAVRREADQEKSDRGGCCLRDGAYFIHSVAPIEKGKVSVLDGVSLFNGVGSKTQKC